MECILLIIFNFTKKKEKYQRKNNSNLFYICSFLFFFCDKKEKKRNQRKEKERRIKRAFTVFEQKFHLTRSCKFLLKFLKSLTKGFARQGHKPLYFFKIVFKPVLTLKNGWKVFCLLFSFAKKKEKYQRETISFCFYTFISFLLNCVGKRKETKQRKENRRLLKETVKCFYGIFLATSCYKKSLKT